MIAFKHYIGNEKVWFVRRNFLNYVPIYFNEQNNIYMSVQISTLVSSLGKWSQEAAQSHVVVAWKPNTIG